MALQMAEASAVIKQFQKKEGDTGSTEVQVALLTAQIKKLAPHFSVHVKDAHSQRGLMVMINKRRGLLRYLKKNNPQSYVKLVKDLELRG